MLLAISFSFFSISAAHKAAPTKMANIRDFQSKPSGSRNKKLTSVGK